MDPVLAHMVEAATTVITDMYLRKKMAGTFVALIGDGVEYSMLMMLLPTEGMHEALKMLGAQVEPLTPPTKN